MIRILASVKGGVTGSRQSWLKSNGEIREFESLAEAQQVTAELNATMKGPAGVTIRYETIGDGEDCTTIDRAKAAELLATATQLQAAFWDALSDLEEALDGSDRQRHARSRRHYNRRTAGGSGRRRRRIGLIIG